MTLSNATEPERIIPIADLCESLNCTPITLQRACVRHGVPLTVLSRSKRGLTVADYVRLLDRARGGYPLTEGKKTGDAA